MVSPGVGSLRGRTAAARVGHRPFGKKHSAGGKRAIRVRSQSAVSRHAAGGRRTGDRIPALAPGGALRRSIRTDLSSGDRTRRATPARTLRKLRRLREACPALVANAPRNEIGASLPLGPLRPQPRLSGPLGLLSRSSAPFRQAPHSSPSLLPSTSPTPFPLFLLFPLFLPI